MTINEFWNTNEHVAVHCNTKEKYNRFLNRLIEVTDADWGYPTWEECYEEETCISSGIVFGKESIFKKINYKIIEFDELEDFKEENNERNKI